MQKSLIANSLQLDVIPAKAGIQKYYSYHCHWIPHPPIGVEGRQVRNDGNKAKNLSIF